MGKNLADFQSVMMQCWEQVMYRDLDRSADIINVLQGLDHSANGNL